MGALPLNDDATIAALLAGDEAAFAALVDRHLPGMRSVATSIVGSRAIAEEVVQDTWIGVLEGLPKFERRSSLRTWMYRILVNRARTRATREGRSVPFSALGDDEDGVAPDADRFDERGAWRTPPERWSITPERLASSRELHVLVERAIDELPERQKAVLRLRDVEGWSSDEVRNALDLSETNQRVLLHRARAKVRAWLEPHLTGQP